MKNISKSKYIDGIGCPVLFWKKMHEPESLPPVDAETQQRFDDGHVAGELAKELYPGGVDMPTDDFGENIRLATELVKERKIIFEAGFSARGLYCRCDVLVPRDDGSWELIEVKGTTDAKKAHHHDLSFQRYVLEACGLRISSASVIHLNNKYVRRGDLDVNELFIKTDVTNEVAALLPNVEPNVARLREILDMPECPEIQPFGQCNAFYGCPFHDEIEMPEGHVTDLNRGGKAAARLMEQGIEMLTEVPDNFSLTPRQTIQVQCSKSLKPHVEPEPIGEFISRLQFPIRHLDFETVAFAVPQFDESRPYQQVPFQYSIHEEHRDGRVEHHEFLGVGEGDPRRELLESMRVNLGDEGTITVYYQSFEKTRLKELAIDFPEYAGWIDTVLDRVVDLYEVFSNFWYYNPMQRGSASIKKVLPAITDLSYDDMEIAGGSAAAAAFPILRKAGESVDNYDADMKALRENLLAYCKLDTLAMVEVLKKLRELV